MGEKAKMAIGKRLAATDPSASNKATSAKSSFIHASISPRAVKDNQHEIEAMIKVRISKFAKMGRSSFFRFHW